MQHSPVRVNVENMRLDPKLKEVPQPIFRSYIKQNNQSDESSDCFYRPVICVRLQLQILKRANHVFSFLAPDTGTGTVYVANVRYQKEIISKIFCHCLEAETNIRYPNQPNLNSK